MGGIRLAADIAQKSYVDERGNESTTSRVTIRYALNGMLAIECGDGSCTVYAEDLLRAIKALESSAIDLARNN